MGMDPRSVWTVGTATLKERVRKSLFSDSQTKAYNLKLPKVDKPLSA
jgi:phage terminase large subunit GpA-like protein